MRLDVHRRRRVRQHRGGAPPRRLGRTEHVAPAAIEPGADAAAERDLLIDVAVIAHGGLDRELVAVEPGLHEQRAGAHRRHRDQGDVLPDPDDAVQGRSRGLRPAVMRVARIAQVGEPGMAHADAEVVASAGVDERGDVAVEGQEAVLVLGHALVVDQHQAVARHRLEMEEDAPSAPRGGDSDGAVEPAHLDPIPGSWVAGEAHRVRPVGMLGAGTDIAAAAPAVGIPRGWDADPHALPVLARQRPCGRDAVVALPCARQRHRLEAPQAIEAALVAEAALGRRDLAFARGEGTGKDDALAAGLGGAHRDGQGSEQDR